MPTLSALALKRQELQKTNPNATAIDARQALT